MGHKGSNRPGRSLQEKGMQQGAAAAKALVRDNQTDLDCGTAHWTTIVSVI